MPEEVNKFCVLGRTAGRTVSKQKRKFFDTEAEAITHGEKIISDRYREAPGQPHITLYVAAITQVLEVGAPIITKRRPVASDTAADDAEDAAED